MKEKRYFCDWFNKIENNRWIVIAFLGLIVISCLTTYCVFKNNYDQEVATYSEKDYEYLNDLVLVICDKDSKSINLANIPDGVQICEATFDKHEISFQCILNRDFNFIDNPCLSVNVTDNFNDIYVTRKSKDEVTSSTSLIFLSIMIGILFIGIPVFSIYCIMLGASSISLANKREDARNNFCAVDENFFDDYYSKFLKK